MDVLPGTGMKGFDSEFRDLDHYIRLITARIWEGRRVDDIHKYYADPCVVETPAGVTLPVAAVVSGTLATLAEFPDRRLLAEDIIVSGDDSGGYLSSHRIISTMTHRGSGRFGAATGRRVHVRTIADCVCKDNRIVHEWLVRDQAAIALALGIAPPDLARRWLAEGGGWTKQAAPAAPAYYRSHISEAPLAQNYAAALRDLSSNTARVASAYDEAVHHIGPGNATAFGHEELEAFWTGLYGALKVERFEIEHLALAEGPGSAPRVAVRWRAQAVHAGAGRYGEATGKPVEILGINHAEFRDGKVIREWVLIDDIALWMQILAADLPQRG
jgi:predicted ester cyclase